MSRRDPAQRALVLLAGAVAGRVAPQSKASAAWPDGLPVGRLGAAAAWSERGNVSRLRRAWSRDLLVGGGSPVVAGGRVYLGVTGGNGNGWVYALDAATGATRWTADTGTPYPPKHLALAGGRLVVPTTGDPDGLLLALDQATGRRLWATKLTPGTRSDWWHPPNVAGGRIYLGGTTPKIYSVDAATGRIVWRSTAATIGPPAVVGNRVYAADEGGALFAKDVTNGVNR